MEKSYLTINKAAQIPDMPSACTLRAWLKQGQLPGFYAGTRFYVAVDVLREKLDRESRESVTR